MKNFSVTVRLVARKYHEDEIVKAVLAEVKRRLNMSDQAWKTMQAATALGRVNEMVGLLFYHVQNAAGKVEVPDVVLKDVLKLLLVRPLKGRGPKRCPVCGQDAPKP